MTISNLALKANCKIPLFRSGSFVSKMAAIMIPIKGITAFFTLRFNKIKMPQRISRKAVTYNRKSGNGSPKPINISVSSVLNIFITPDVIKTNATAYRIKLAVVNE
jgi:hypothetical protein